MNFKEIKFKNRNEKITIEYIRKFVEEKGGVLISTEYINAHEKLTVMCPKHEGGYIWHPRWMNLKTGNWCSHQDCSNAKAKVSEATKKKKNGFRVVKTLDLCKKNERNVETSCDFNHINIMPRNRYRKLANCPDCRSVEKSSTLKDYGHKVALYNQGVLLSSPDTAIGLFEFKCENDHIFTKPKNSLDQFQWCPECFGYQFNKVETFVRDYLERLLGFDLKKSRPEFLLNKSSGRRLEFDGYNEVRKIAFEYDGKQHYSSVSFFNKEDTLKIRIERDLLKEQLCKDNNILLIRLKGLDVVSPKDIKKDIDTELQKLNIKLPNNLQSIYPNFRLAMYLIRGSGLKTIHNLIKLGDDSESNLGG